MLDVYMLRSVASACELFAPSCPQDHAAEPGLDDLMSDPMTRALMAADRVDTTQLHALLTQLRENLRGPIARLSV